MRATQHTRCCGAPALGGTRNSARRPWLRSGHDDERRASFNAAVSLLLFGWEVPGLPQHGVVLRHAAAIAA